MYNLCHFSDNLTGIVVGSVIGSLALITMAATIILHSKKQKQKRYGIQKQKRYGIQLAGNVQATVN